LKARGFLDLGPSYAILDISGNEFVIVRPLANSKPRSRQSEIAGKRLGSTHPEGGAMEKETGRLRRFDYNETN
jgi:hypothetical protein